MNTILIIGAKSDVAMELASIYANNGYNLYLAARNPSSLAEFAQDLRIRTRRNIDIFELDITDYQSHPNFFASLYEQPVGVLVCAGYLGDQSLGQVDFSEADKIISSNYLGVVSFLNIVAEEFEKTKRGFIVSISSVAGDRGRKSNYLYGSAKAGLTAYLSGLRNRLHSADVPVLTVKPGFIYSKMTASLDLPSKLTATPKDVAKAIFIAQQKKMDIVYVKPLWKFIMLIIKHIPEPIFKRLSI